MAEWLKAAVLKTVVRKYRGFESYLLRHLKKLNVDLIDGLTENNEVTNGEVTERPMVAPC